MHWGVSALPQDMAKQQAVNPDFNPVPELLYFTNADPYYQFPETYLELL